jgi:hypothetical protein
LQDLFRKIKEFLPSKNRQDVVIFTKDKKKNGILILHLKKKERINENTVSDDADVISLMTYIHSGFHTMK